MREEYLNEGADAEMLEELKTVSVVGSTFSYIIIYIHMYIHM